MARPSQKTDEKLIAAAIEILPRTGYSGLKMRAVAKKAGVNLGMFHYHFKNKEEFINRVATEFYERFYQAFTLEAAAGEGTKEQLQKAIMTMIRFARDNRRLILAMGRDLLDGNQQLVRLLEGFIPRHGMVLIRLVRECQKKGLIAKVPLPLALTYLIGSMAGPIMIAAFLEHIRLRQPYDFLKKFAVPFILSDKVIATRLELVFRGLDPDFGEGFANKQWEIKTDQFLRAMEADQKNSQTKSRVIKPIRKKSTSRRRS